MGRLDFGKWLEEERLIRGWSQRELGRRMGTSGSHISNVEAGSVGTTADFCHKLARVFSADIVDVLRMADLIGNSVPSRPETLAHNATTQKLLDLMATISPEQQEVILKIAELAINGYGNEKAALGRASPKQKAETQPT